MAKINSRAKGATFERTISNYLKSKGYEARRGQQFCGANGDPDIITSIENLYFELKAVENLNLHKAMEQAVEDNKDENKYPTVIHKKNRKGTLVTMRLEDFFNLFDSVLDKELK